MVVKIRFSRALIVVLISASILTTLLFPNSFADKCVRCKNYAGNGGNGGDGGIAIAAPVGPGGSCVAEIIGDACGGSTGSSEPRGGQGGNGGDGGDSIIFGDKTSIKKNDNDTRLANSNASVTD
jgi:hypothetical protein